MDYQKTPLLDRNWVTVLSSWDCRVVGVGARIGRRQRGDVLKPWSLMMMMGVDTEQTRSNLQCKFVSRVLGKLTWGSWLIGRRQQEMLIIRHVLLLGQR